MFNKIVAFFRSKPLQTYVNVLIVIIGLLADIISLALFFGVIHTHKDAEAHISLASIYRKQGQTAVYKKQIEITRPLIANSDAYNRACFASIAGEVEEAVELLKEAIAIAPADRQMAQNDPDFEFIRDDPRFQAVVGAA